MRKLLLVLPFLLLARVSFAQTDDFGAWMTFSVDKELFKDFSVGIDQELRLRENLQNLNLIYTNLGASYKLSKYFKVSVIYRFIDKHKGDNTWGIRHRIMTDFAFKVKPGKFTLGYRARFQEEWRGMGYSSELGSTPEVFMRNLFKIAYKASDRWEPYAGAELRWQLVNPHLPWGNGFDRTRYFAGTNYEINKHNTAGAYFLVQKEYNVNDPQSLYIIGLEYSISLD